MAREPAEVDIEDDLSTASLLVGGRRPVEDVCSEVGVLLLHGLVSVEEVNWPAGDGVVQVVADLGGEDVPELVVVVALYNKSADDSNQRLNAEGETHVIHQRHDPLAEMNQEVFG